MKELLYYNGKIPNGNEFLAEYLPAASGKKTDSSYRVVCKTCNKEMIKTHIGIRELGKLHKPLVCIHCHEEKLIEELNTILENSNSSFRAKECKSITPKSTTKNLDNVSLQCIHCGCSIVYSYPNIQTLTSKKCECEKAQHYTDLFLNNCPNAGEFDIIACDAVAAGFITLRCKACQEEFKVHINTFYSKTGIVTNPVKCKTCYQNEQLDKLDTIYRDTMSCLDPEAYIKSLERKNGVLYANIVYKGVTYTQNASSVHAKQIPKVAAADYTALLNEERHLAEEKQNEALTPEEFSELEKEIEHIDEELDMIQDITEDEFYEDEEENPDLLESDEDNESSQTVNTEAYLNMELAYQRMINTRLSICHMLQDKSINYDKVTDIKDIGVSVINYLDIFIIDKYYQDNIIILDAGGRECNAMEEDFDKYNEYLALNLLIAYIPTGWSELKLKEYLNNILIEAQEIKLLESKCRNLEYCTAGMDYVSFYQHEINYYKAYFDYLRAYYKFMHNTLTHYSHMYDCVNDEYKFLKYLENIEAEIQNSLKTAISETIPNNWKEYEERGIFRHTL